MNEFFDRLRCGIPKKIADVAKQLATNFSRLGNNCRRGKVADKPLCYESCVGDCACMAYYWHLGFRTGVSPRRIAKKGAAMALAYFGAASRRLALAKPGTRWDKEVPWFLPYSEGLLLATLGGCAQERAAISDYLHPKLAVETRAIAIEPALGDVLLCIAASFQSKPMKTGPLEERVAKCRKQRPKLLFKAWQALEIGDRPAFVGALVDSTTNFAKTTAIDGWPDHALAVQESILAALAFERGWTDLTFELPIAARLVTHQSLGLD